MSRLLFPKPQFERSEWMNLNGEWDFHIDFFGESEPEGIPEFDKKINVPFCPECPLSGIGIKDYMRRVVYRKTAVLNREQLSGLVRLHVGAADYETRVYVNGKLCGKHRGGYVSFFADITDAAVCGDNEIVIECFDDTRSYAIPSGKQATEPESSGCMYTRCTGIWQTVWLEFLPKTHLESVRFQPNINGSVRITAVLTGKEDFSAEVTLDGRPVGCFFRDNACGTIEFTVDLSEVVLWDIGQGNLYDVTFRFGEDRVKSYFGLREIHFDGYRFMLNNRSVFMRLVLDQGYYPDGLYTAPDDGDLLKDIQMSKACGFNGARLHQKVFEERFLYYADKEGYLCWGEYPNWGLDFNKPEAFYNLTAEWTEEVDRDYNHPSIIGWCPLNETWGVNDWHFYRFALPQLYRLTKALDPFRPVIDTSGNFHVLTDIYDEHDYEQDPVKFGKTISDFNESEKDIIANWTNEKSEPYVPGTPVMMSEYGGIRWTREMAESSKNPAENNACVSWGYGAPVDSPEGYMQRFKALTDILMDSPKICGICYTQLTDVEQEQNGVYYYNREQKFDPEFYRSVFARKAAIED